MHPGQPDSTRNPDPKQTDPDASGLNRTSWTSPTAAVGCANCGTPRPERARFCPTCGTDFLAPEATAAPVAPPTPRLDMVELGSMSRGVPGAATASGRAATSSLATNSGHAATIGRTATTGHTATGQVSGGTTNTLRLGITIGAALLAIIIGWSLLSGDTATADTTGEAQSSSAETAASTDGIGAAAESDTGNGTSTAEEVTGQRDDTNNDFTAAAGIAEGQSLTQTPEGAADAVDALVSDFSSLNLPGFLVQTSSSGIKVIDLSTGQLVDVFEQDMPNAIATTDGVLCCGTSQTIQVGAQGDWTLHPWNGSAPVTIALDNGESVRATLHDPDVGLLVIAGQSNGEIFNGGLTGGYAIRVETGERREVDLHETQPFGVPALWGDEAGDNMLASISNTIFTWRWETGWTVLSEGVLRSEAATHYVADRCVDPTDCVRELFDPTGEVLAELPADLLSFGLNGTTISPDRRHLVAEFFSTRGPSLQLLDLTSGSLRDLETRAQPQASSFSTAATWVTSDYLIVPGELGRYKLMDIRGNESWEIPELRNNRLTLTWIPDSSVLDR